MIIVDDDIDPSNPVEVEYAMATRFQADKDLVIIPNVRGSSLDPSSDQKNLRTAKMGVDATKSFSKRAEGFEIAKIPRCSKDITKNLLQIKFVYSAESIIKAINNIARYGLENLNNVHDALSDGFTSNHTLSATIIAPETIAV